MDPVAVAIIAALFGGLGGALVTGVLTWRVAIGQREFERQQAREARRQTRLERTYRDTLEHLYLLEAAVNRTAPIISFDGEPGPPDFPDESKMRSLNAAVAVFGSKAICESLRGLSKAMSGFQAAVWELQAAQSAREPKADLWEKVEEKRKAFRALHAEIIELANAELDARSD
jgi:Sec-independent protein translocase protein TatA